MFGNEGEGFLHACISSNIIIMGMDIIMPAKTIKLHINDVPWMTAWSSEAPNKVSTESFKR